MSEQSAPPQIPGMENPNANPGALNGIPATDAADISMTDAPAAAPTTHEPPGQPQPTPHQATPSTAPSPVPTTAPRVPTPVPVPTPTGTGTGTGTQPQPPSNTSRAASLHPDQGSTAATTTSSSSNAGFTMPTEAAPNGAPVRQYINSRITGVLLEGMKIVAREQPKDPLRVLGEFLLQRSKELEGKDSGSSS